MTPEELQKLEQEVNAIDEELRTDENFDDYERGGRYKAPSFDDYLEEKFPERYRELKEKGQQLDQAKEEARRRAANEAPIPGDEDAPADLPEEAGKVTVAPVQPAPKKPASEQKPKQLELDLKRSAQSAELLKNAAKARRAIKAGKSGADVLKLLGKGAMRGLSLPIQLLSIIAEPAMKTIIEEKKKGPRA
jgi:hypothetical protein